MDHLVAARKLVAELEKDQQIEVRRADAVGRALAKHVEALGRPPTGRELEDFLGDHPMVEELYASEAVLDELVFRYLTPPPPEAVISAADVRHPELEAQLRETPDNIDALRIYADFLQEQADPFGELIALGIASTASGKDEDVARFERHLKLHERRFL